MMNITRTQQEGHTHHVCPNCGTELCGGLIKDTIVGNYTDEEIKQMYGDSKCYSMVIGVEVRGKYDGVAYWRFPCCNAEYDRFTGRRTM